MRASSLTLALTLSLSPLALAQESDVPDVLRVETRLVVVDVVVRDDDGPVGDLTVEDFRLFDDGVEQPIELFERTVIDEVRLPGDRPSLPPDAVSNRPGIGGDPPASATVLLMDWLNTPVMQRPYAIQQAVKFLESLDPRHQVAVYELAGNLRVVQDFTNDRERLIRAVTGADAELPIELDASSGEGLTGGFEAQPDEIGLDPALVRARENPGAGIEELGTVLLDSFVGAYFRESRVVTTGLVLDAIARQMAHLPGRKNLVWLADSFPFTFEPYSYFSIEDLSNDRKAELVRVARAITDANLAIYPISTVGLRPPGPPSIETMTNIANVTGGKAFYYTNGLAEAIAEAVDDTELTYTIGFYPETAALDSDFHELRVLVDRDDVDVRHRKGYYGFGTVSETVVAETREMYRDLLTSPVNATGVGLFTTRSPIASDPPTWETRVWLDVNDVDLAYSDGTWNADIGIATVILEPGDANGIVESGILSIRLPDEEFVSARENGYELFRLTGSGANPAWLRVAVEDPLTGATGSLWVELE